MDPILIGLLAVLIAAGAFIIVKLVSLTGKWLSAKLKQLMSGKKDAIGISGDKLKEILAEVAEDATEVTLDDLDMMLATIDQDGEVSDIELISAEEGMDIAAANFMRQNGELIRVTCGS